MGQDEKPNDTASPHAGQSPPEPNRPPKIRSAGRSWTRLCLALTALAGAGVAVWMFLMPATPKPPEPARPNQPAAPARIAGSKWLDQYAKLDAENAPARHRMVLEQIAEGNLPETWDDWVLVRVTGRKGTEVQFEVSPHGLRIGTKEDWVEVPLDGPHFAAAAEILDCQLATAWMVEQIHLQPGNHEAIHFFAATELAHSLGYDDWKPNAPDGRKMQDAAFFRQRSALLKSWLTAHGVEADALVSGYFKSVVPPIDGITKKDGLEMIGGYTDAGDRIQGLSGGFHHQIFFDYSHNIRVVRKGILVNGESMTAQEFFQNVSFALEFGFRATSVPVPAYPYPPELEQWMASHR